MVIIGEATSHDELIALFRARKETLALSNELVDHLVPLSQGHCDKLLGPSHTRGLSHLSLDGMLGVLALKLVVVADPVQSACMRPKWEGRDTQQVRPPSRVAATMIKRLATAARALPRAGVP